LLYCTASEGKLLGCVSASTWHERRNKAIAPYGATVLAGLSFHLPALMLPRGTNLAMRNHVAVQ
jgi:hypothetical protein